MIYIDIAYINIYNICIVNDLKNLNRYNQVLRSCSRVGRGNPVSKHSVPYFQPNFGNSAVSDVTQHQAALPQREVTIYCIFHRYII